MAYYCLKQEHVYGLQNAADSQRVVPETIKIILEEGKITLTATHCKHWKRKYEISSVSIKLTKRHLRKTPEQERSWDGCNVYSLHLSQPRSKKHTFSRRFHETLIVTSLSFQLKERSKRVFLLLKAAAISTAGTLRRSKVAGLNRGAIRFAISSPVRSWLPRTR